MRVTTTTIVLTMLLSLLSVLSLAVDPSHYPPEVAALMDFTADPCQDFWEYSCGTWLKNTTLPPTEPIIDRAITSIEDANQQILIQLLVNNSNTTSQKYPMIIPYFNDCMDTTTINQLGVAPLETYWMQVSNLASLEDVMKAVAFLHSLQFPALFSFGVVTDAGNMTADVTIAEFDQGGITLPDRDMYLATDPQSRQVIQQYQTHISNMFALLGEQDTEAIAKSIVYFETQVASANVPSDQIRNPYAVYNKINVPGLEYLVPQIPWDAYLAALGQPDLFQLNVAEPAFFKALGPIVATTDVSVLENYLKWYLLHNVANFLSDAFVNETFSFFGQVLEGQTEMSPRLTTCISQTDSALGNILGQAYADVAFGGNSITLIGQMIDGIENAFYNELQALDWMDNVTRQAAELKLSEVTRRVGYPQNPSYYPGYTVFPGEYFASTIQKSAYDFAMILTGLGKAPDRNKWEMTADTVNAYYEPTDNSINFPAGIMQNPFFLASRNPAMNFGGIGVVIGHELTHGFDDQGSVYDGHGKLSNWWQNATLQHYHQATACMAAQYSQYQILPGVYVNGNLTLGENIADNGGVLNAYNAYTQLSVSKGQTPDYPLLFVSYAQGWCSKAQEEFEKLRIKTDVHSPPKFRVIGLLSNFQAFSNTFSCPIGSVMNPVTKCKVW